MTKAVIQIPYQLKRATDWPWWFGHVRCTIGLMDYDRIRVVPDAFLSPDKSVCPHRVICDPITKPVEPEKDDPDYMAQRDRSWLQLGEYNEYVGYHTPLFNAVRESIAPDIKFDFGAFTRVDELIEGLRSFLRIDSGRHGRVLMMQWRQLTSDGINKYPLEEWCERLIAKYQDMVKWRVVDPRDNLTWVTEVESSVRKRYPQVNRTFWHIMEPSLSFRGEGMFESFVDELVDQLAEIVEI